LHGRPHSLGNKPRAKHSNFGKQRSELVAANARHDVPTSNEQPEGMAYRAQQCISSSMTLVVVDRLQTIDIQGENRKGLTWDGAQSTVEFAAVLQTGERIRGGELGEFHRVIMEGILGAHAVEVTADVMTCDMHRLDQLPWRPPCRLMEDHKYPDDTTCRTDRKGQDAMDPSGSGFRRSVEWTAH
jgi:hypothetical protein